MTIIPYVNFYHSSTAPAFWCTQSPRTPFFRRPAFVAVVCHQLLGGYRDRTRGHEPTFAFRTALPKRPLRLYRHRTAVSFHFHRHPPRIPFVFHPFVCAYLSHPWRARARRSPSCGSLQRTVLHRAGCTLRPHRYCMPRACDRGICDFLIKESSPWGACRGAGRPKGNFLMKKL